MGRHNEQHDMIILNKQIPETTMKTLVLAVLSLQPAGHQIMYGNVMDVLQIAKIKNPPAEYNIYFSW